LSFSIAIFFAALWALSSEMAEDSLVDLVYGHLYGWRTLVRALISASIILVTLSALLVYFALTLLVEFVTVVSRASAGLLVLIGLFWLLSSVRAIARKEDEMEELSRIKLDAKSGLRNFMVAFQLVSIEELEILLIVIPLLVSSHGLEAFLAAAIGIATSLTTALVLRRNFEKFVAGKLKYVKIVSGFFLIGLGIVLFLEI
jgi:uncharacterized membrane protein